MILPPATDTQEKPFAAAFSQSGIAVSREESPRILIRYPGACGVRDHFNESLVTLARTDLKSCHFTTELIPYIRKGARRFGLFVVPNPNGRIPLIRLPGEEPAYLSENLALTRDQDYCWVPASLLAEIQSEEQAVQVSEILDRHGERIAEARLNVRIELDNYFGEVRQVISSGVPLPEERWHELPEVRRRAILREIGVKPTWTLTAAERLALQ
jgi:hypothetical protein